MNAISYLLPTAMIALLAGAAHGQDAASRHYRTSSTQSEVYSSQIYGHGDLPVAGPVHYQQHMHPGPGTCCCDPTSAYYSGNLWAGWCCDPTCYRSRLWSFWDALRGLRKEVRCGVPNPCCHMDPGCCCRGHGTLRGKILSVFSRPNCNCYDACGGTGCPNCCGGEMLYPSRPVPHDGGVIYETKSRTSAPSRPTGHRNLQETAPRERETDSRNSNSILRRRSSNPRT